jgi:tripartite-type tricarboxylate transporter receptor subunit TctC
MRQTIICGFAGVVLALTAVLPAHPQAWPQRPVKIVVPFAPGGNTDGLARIISQPLTEAFGQPFIVENRPGAAGALAAEAVAHAPPDGSTLLVGTPTQFAVLPAMAKAPYDPVKEFAPISVIGTNPYVLVIHPSIPARTLTEFVDYVRGQPNKITYAAPVFGGLSHLTMVLFLKRAGLEMQSVSYRGGATPMTDVIGGHVQVYFALLSDVLPHASSESVRLLAVSSEKRATALPNVPTVAESGFPGFKAVTWNGLLAPAGIRKDIVDAIAREVARAAKDSRFIEQLAAFGVDPVGNNPAEFAAMITADLALWGEAVRLTGLQEK